MQPRVIVALVAAILLAGLNAASLVGDGYARIAEQRLDTPEAQSAVAIAGMARDLQPWSSRDAALAGWALAENRNADEAAEAYADALRAAPGDPLLWAEYAQALARLGRFDEALTAAVAQADALAPQSPAVQGTLADLGIAYWEHGTPEQRAHWLGGLLYEQKHARASLLTRVVTRGGLNAFCGEPAKALGEGAWCASMAAVALGNGCYVVDDRGPVPCPP